MKQLFNSEDKKKRKKNCKTEKIFQKKSSRYILRTLFNHTEDSLPRLYFYTIFWHDWTSNNLYVIIQANLDLWLATIIKNLENNLIQS